MRLGKRSFQQSLKTCVAMLIAMLIAMGVSFTIGNAVASQASDGGRADRENFPTQMDEESRARLNALPEKIPVAGPGEDGIAGYVDRNVIHGPRQGRQSEDQFGGRPGYEVQSRNGDTVGYLVPGRGFMESSKAEEHRRNNPGDYK